MFTPRFLLVAILFAAALPAQKTLCKFVKYGNTCGAEFEGSDKLEGNPVHHKFTLQIKNAPKNAPGVLAIGYQPLDVPLPGTMCRLLAYPRRLMPIGTDEKGEMLAELISPKRIRIVAYMQVGLEVNGKILTSNGLVVTCTDF